MLAGLMTDGERLLSRRSGRDDVWCNRTAPYVRGATPEVRQVAKGMRRSPTPAEAALWELLRSKRIDNLRFRRQHPLGPFVLDFCCTAIRLVIEVDLAVHLGAEQQARDEARTEQLAAYGYQVLRFSNDDVLKQPEVVAARIRNIIESMDVQRHAPRED